MPRIPLQQLILAVACSLCAGCNDATQPSRTDVKVQKPVVEPEQLNRDNTGVNVRDRDSARKTPVDQNENKADVERTAEIRKRVIDAQLSTDGHNVKIITQGGKVTLRGPVKSAEEKETIEKIAKDVAGPDRVDSQLEIETQK